MTASTAQGAKLYFATALDDTDTAITDRADDTDWGASIPGTINLEAGIPIRGDIEATNLDSTSMEFIDDVYEELTFPCTIQADLTNARHQALMDHQADKDQIWFLAELPEPEVATVTRVIIRGWVRNWRWTGTPRAVQQASFDILTREAVTIDHAAAAE